MDPFSKNNLAQENIEIADVVTIGRSATRFPPVAWSAIFAGLIAGLATHILLILFGIATGMTAINVTAEGTGVQDVPTWTAVWNGLSLLIAAFVSGFVAARMSGLRRKMDGFLHGFVVWGATTILYALLSASAMATLFGGVFSSVTQTAANVTQDNTTVNPIERMRLFLSTNTDINPDMLTPENMNVLQSFIIRGDREGAVSFLQVTMGVSPEQSANLVDALMIMTGSPELATPETRQQINQGVDIASAALWILFFAVLLSATISVIGGLMGVKNVSRGAQHPVAH
jgi:hypothetical protein